ncbi:MAG: APC family permease [Solirubrobacterales bacterium]|nr:APC family permease [Solirubrobacterales bacterium]
MTDLDGQAQQQQGQGLHRGLNFVGNVALTVSDITPTASLLVVGPVVIATAGSGSILAYLIGCFLALNVALCMGELGSMFPSAGGLYSIVTRVIGRPVGFIGLLLYIGQAVFLPASIAIGVGVYINSLVSGVSTSAAAVAVMISVTLLALLKINFNAVLTGFFLALELSVVVILFAAGILNLDQPASIITDPVIVDGGALASVATGAIVTALATALFSVNGYDSAINFSEETEGSPAQIGKAVVTAALIGILFELVPFVASVFGAPDLKAFLSSATPLTDVIDNAFGATVVDIVTVGAIIAIFNASLAITLQFARITWSTGRDRAWPGPVSDALSRVNSNGAPWVATLFIGACATVLCLKSSLQSVVSSTAVMIITMYALIAISSLVSRVRQRELPRPYKMPLWPVPPLIALTGVVIALSKQTERDLLIVGGMFVFGALYYAGYLRGGDRFVPHEETPR